METSLKTVRNVFDAASEISDRSARAAYVAQACDGDPDLRRRVEDLLRAHDTAGVFLQGGSPPEQVSAAAAPPEAIGRYRLIEKLGEGGCGVVYLADKLFSDQCIVADDLQTNDRADFQFNPATRTDKSDR